MRNYIIVWGKVKNNQRKVVIKHDWVFLRLGSGKPPATVILDGKKLSEDEDDEDGQFVVEEVAAPPLDIPEIEVV